MSTTNKINWYPAFCVDYTNGYITYDSTKGYKCIKKYKKISGFKQKKIHDTEGSNER